MLAAEDGAPAAKGVQSHAPQGRAPRKHADDADVDEQRAEERDGALDTVVGYGLQLAPVLRAVDFPAWWPEQVFPLASCTTIERCRKVPTAHLLSS